MVGRIMIGKLPKSIQLHQLDETLMKIPLPRRDVEPVENCVTWTFAAIHKLQALGAVDEFDVGVFMDHALARANHWCDGGIYPRENTVENYTRRAVR